MLKQFIGTIPRQNLQIFIIVAIIILTGIFYIATVHPGHNWGDDFAHYIHHAKNLAERLDYKETGYIFNPANPISPKTEPPVFPMILALVYKLFGLNLVAMKIEIILIFLMALFVLYLAFERVLPFAYATTLVALVGLHPFFWVFRDNVLTDLPFFFFVWTALFLIHHIFTKDTTVRISIAAIALIALFSYLAYGTRAIGLVIIPCLVAYDIVRTGRLTGAAIGVGACTASFAAVQGLFFHGFEKSFEVFYITPQHIINNLIIYRNIIVMFWDNGYAVSVAAVWAAVISLIGLYGYLRKLMTEVTIFEIFAVFYLAIVLAWPTMDGPRFIFPLIPLYLYYIIVGIRDIARFVEEHRRIYLPVAVITISLLIYGARYTAMDYGPVGEGVAMTETINLFDFVRKNTDPQDVFIFAKPRAFALYTDRRAAVYHAPQDDRELWFFMRQINASYIIISRIFPSDVAFMVPFVMKYRSVLEEVYTNPDFKVFRINKEFYR